MKTTGQRIKELRYALSKEPGKKISQEKMGKYAGVTKAAVSQWEKEITLPERDPLLAMQKSLGISIDWLISGIGEMFLKKYDAHGNASNKYMGVKETGIHNLNNDENNLVQSYRLLKEEQQEYIQLSVSTLIEQNTNQTPPKQFA